MELEPFALERFQSIWENRVAWNLAESGVHPLSVAELADTDALKDALLQVHLGYPQTNGTIELRGLIANIYAGATPDHVEVTNGGSEANCVLLLRLTRPGDSIVFMTPNYLQASGFARGLGADLRPWPLREDPAGKRWLVDVDELRRLVTPRTRAILLCNPNNPTGARLDASTLDDICRIASSVGAWVISDEIYRGAEREAEDTPTVWGRYERAIVSSGLSKAYGLPGLRIGWIVAPPSLIEELWAVHDYTTIAPGAISDCLARVALAPDRRHQLLARTRAIIRSNYPLVAEWLRAHDGLSHIAPEAGAITLVRYRHPIDSVTLVSRLRDERGVLIAAGAHFDMEGYVRIGFGSNPAHLSRALAVAGEFLDSVLAHAR
jgi:aspartate/methionine/tyrosine aminotransferase